jgi:hypothetical protein
MFLPKNMTMVSLKMDNLPTLNMCRLRFILYDLNQSQSHGWHYDKKCINNFRLIVAEKLILISLLQNSHLKSNLNSTKNIFENI